MRWGCHHGLHGVLQRFSALEESEGKMPNYLNMRVNVAQQMSRKGDYWSHKQETACDATTQLVSQP